MNIAFRVDSGTNVGLGHLNRCISISHQLVKKNRTPIFIISNSSSKDIIESFGFKWIVIKNNKNEISQIKKILNIYKINILVIDSKRKSLENLLKSLKKHTKIVVIDNTKVAKHADLTILPAVKEQYYKYPKNSLIGSKYVLLNPNIRSAKNTSKKEFIFLSLGGADKYNITKKFISAFVSNKSNFKLIIVLGKFYRNEKDLKNLIKDDNRFFIFRDPPNFHTLMKKSIMGIITFGITIYEAAALRLPTFVVSHSNENDYSAKRVEQYGWYKYLGKYNTINYSEAVKSILLVSKNKHMLNKMKLNQQRIDLKGNERVANAILKLVKS